MESAFLSATKVNNAHGGTSTLKRRLGVLQCYLLLRCATSHAADTSDKCNLNPVPQPLLPMDEPEHRAIRVERIQTWRHAGRPLISLRVRGDARDKHSRQR